MCPRRTIKSSNQEIPLWHVISGCGLLGFDFLKNRQNVNVVGPVSLAPLLWFFYTPFAIRKPIDSTFPFLLSPDPVLLDRIVKPFALPLFVVQWIDFEDTKRRWGWLLSRNEQVHRQTRWLFRPLDRQSPFEEIQRRCVCLLSRSEQTHRHDGWLFRRPHRS